MKFIDKCGLNSFNDFDSFINKYRQIIVTHYPQLNNTIINVVDVDNVSIISEVF